ncbi:MAG: zonular occludens toxin domain-containing protein [Thiomonas sp.]|uniref:zonular occludens toxin domain-containing protein n=1 Tax=Thiomonas sp. TaxID=2047785 RepID=UPI002A36C190|nr:zonular occludens toxin domain-containing protein [Thiomonas sp.]MDY0331831.1 zonular occludens toxin domain-containing protein [Thiomonas sp.]
MAIKHITGVPGTGKTYFAINDVILRYYKFSDTHVEWQYDDSKPNKPVLIYTNIENLKLTHVNIDSYCSSHNIDIYTFFTTDYWEQYIDYKNYQIVIILDEAQRYFPSSYRLRGTPKPGENPLYWFQYHRHFGADVYVITQTYDAVCRHVVQLAEYEIHAITKVYSVGNSFRYVFRTGLHPDDIVARKTFRYDKRVGMLYQSFMSDSDDSRRPYPLRKYTLFFVFLALLLVFGVVRFVGSFGHPGEQTRDPRGGEPTVAESSRAAASSKPSEPVKSAAQRSAPVPQSQIKLPDKQVVVDTGGFWQGDELIAIEFYGDLIPVNEFGFSFRSDRGNNRVRVWLPQSFLDDIQVAKNRRYYKSGSGWQDIESAQYTPDRNYSNYNDAQLEKNSARQQETTRRQRAQERINRDLPF